MSQDVARPESRLRSHLLEGRASRHDVAGASNGTTTIAASGSQRSGATGSAGGKNFVAECCSSGIAAPITAAGNKGLTGGHWCAGASDGTIANTACGSQRSDSTGKAPGATAQQKNVLAERRFRAQLSEAKRTHPSLRLLRSEPPFSWSNVLRHSRCPLHFRLRRDTGNQTRR